MTRPPSLGKRLRAARRAAGMTQDEVAHYANMDRAQVSHYECDKNEPTAHALRRLWTIGCSADYLLGLDDG